MKVNYTIYVDADSCPVKNEISEIASTYGFHVCFIASYAHMPNERAKGEWVFVDSNKEEVDLYIMNHANKLDIVVTQDIGLASILVNKNVYTLSPRGKEYLEDTMDAALHGRYLSAKMRRSGEYSKGPSPFTETLRENFITSFEKMLSKHEGIQQDNIE
jgi:uncharacterized protein